jgi:hypothetical protein
MVERTQFAKFSTNRLVRIDIFNTLKKLTSGTYFLSHVDVNKLELMHKEPFLLCICTFHKIQLFNFTPIVYLAKKQKKISS